MEDANDCNVGLPIRWHNPEAFRRWLADRSGDGSHPAASASAVSVQETSCAHPPATDGRVDEAVQNEWFVHRERIRYPRLVADRLVVAPSECPPLRADVFARAVRGDPAAGIPTLEQRGIWCHEVQDDACILVHNGFACTHRLSYYLDGRHYASVERFCRLFDRQLTALVYDDVHSANTESRLLHAFMAAVPLISVLLQKGRSAHWPPFERSVRVYLRHRPQVLNVVFRMTLYWLRHPLLAYMDHRIPALAWMRSWIPRRIPSIPPILAALARLSFVPLQVWCPIYVQTVLFEAATACVEEGSASLFDQDDNGHEILEPLFRNMAQFIPVHSDDGGERDQEDGDAFDVILKCAQRYSVVNGTDELLPYVRTIASLRSTDDAGRPFGSLEDVEECLGMGVARLVMGASDDDVGGDSDDNDDSMCRVCLTDKAAVAYQPCGHEIACYACYMDLRDRRCPVCRVPSQHVLPVE